MADVKWIKITTDIFDDEKILLIESMPSADSIIVVWFKLLTLAGKQNNDGVFMMGRIAYTDEMLAAIFRRDVNTVRMALNVFEQFGMVEIVDNVITIPNWNKHQSLDAYEKKKAYDRQYRMEQREKQKQIALMSNDCQTTSRTTVVSAEEEKEEEKDKELDIRDREVKTSPSPIQQIVDFYHSICVSFPSVRSLSDARKKAIKARLNTYTVEDFKTMFEKAEASTFLKGSNDRNWTATFDWLIKDSNMAKVLDGNYDDKKKVGGRKEIVPTWMTNDNRAREDMEQAKRLLAQMERENAEMQKPTVGNSPEVAARAEDLRKRLGV